MSRPTFPAIHEPCHESWGAMTPAPGGRHCDVCALDVVDLTEATEEQARARLAAAGDRLCVRMRATRDGTPVFRAPQRRLGRIALAATALAASPLAAASSAVATDPAAAQETWLDGARLLASDVFQDLVSLLQSEEETFEIMGDVAPEPVVAPPEPPPEPPQLTMGRIAMPQEVSAEPPEPAPTAPSRDGGTTNSQP